MKRTFGLGCSLMVGIFVAACSGSAGPAGAPGATGEQGKEGATGATGTKGTSGTGTPSVSVITPPYAFLGRTVDLSIAGSGTTWDASTKVTFANTNVKVNSVTVASATGLLVNVTVSTSATIAATDVTITDGASTTVYKGAFEIRGPLTVTATPTTGVQQGGLANLHVTMNDLTTPFDPDTINVTVSSMDLETSTPTPTDYAFDMTIQADVLAATGTFDLDVTSGEPTTIDSPAKQSFKIAARAPTTLTTTAQGTSNINTELDTTLFEFTPASASQEFIQFTLPEVDAEPSGLALTVIPKSGKYSDYLAEGLGVRYAQGTTSTNPFYVVVGDSDGLFGPGPVPASSPVVAFESPCTAVNQETETATSNNESVASAQVIAALPVLVNGTLGYGSVASTAAQNFYAITVPDTATSIHAATGGDPTDDTLIQIADSTGTVVATSDDLDLQEDLVFNVTSGGTYYVIVTESTEDDSEGNTYQLFIDVK